MIEPLEPRSLLSVTIATPPGPNVIELSDVNGALVISIDGHARYTLHGGVTIIGSGGDTILIDGSIVEPVTVQTSANDTTQIIESVDIDLTLSGGGNVTIEIADTQPNVAARVISPSAIRHPSPAPPSRRGLLKH